MIVRGLWIGTTSGLVLGIYMWMAEKLTGEKVYTLLMNVDFIPVIGTINWSVWMEWLFHLIISWIIGILYIYLVKKKFPHSNRNQWLLSAILTAGAATSYVPLTLLAIKETPPVTDGTAILLWLLGHVLYAITLKKSFK